MFSTYRITSKGKQTRSHLLQHIHPSEELTRDELVQRSGLSYEQVRRQTKNLCIEGVIQPIAPHLQPQPQPIELDTLTPTEQETLQVSEQVSCQMAELNHLPHDSEESHNPIVQPQMSRNELVMALLDEAWARGITTYPQLIGYVAEQSGTGCSKRVVANWKRQRGLLDEAA